MGRFIQWEQRTACQGDIYGLGIFSSGKAVCWHCSLQRRSSNAVYYTTALIQHLTRAGGKQSKGGGENAWLALACSSVFSWFSRIFKICTHLWGPVASFRLFVCSVPGVFNGICWCWFALWKMPSCRARGVHRHSSPGTERKVNPWGMEPPCLLALPTC